MIRSSTRVTRFFFVFVKLTNEDVGVKMTDENVCVKMTWSCVWCESFICDMTRSYVT